MGEFSKILLVINNGHISEFFPLERGVRQGCPLSAYLFILALEMSNHLLLSCFNFLIADNTSLPIILWVPWV